MLTFVKNISKICNILQRCEGDLVLWFFDGTKFVYDLRSQFRPDFRIVGQEVKYRAQQARRCITASKENVEHLVSQQLGVSCILGKCLEEDVSLLILRGFKIPGCVRVKCDLDIIVHKLMANPIGIAKFLRVD